MQASCCSSIWLASDAIPNAPSANRPSIRCSIRARWSSPESWIRHIIPRWTCPSTTIERYAATTAAPLPELLTLFCPAQAPVEGQCHHARNGTRPWPAGREEYSDYSPCYQLRVDLDFRFEGKREFEIGCLTVNEYTRQWIKRTFCCSGGGSGPQRTQR